jgi:hypothetical protein
MTTIIPYADHATLPAWTRAVWVDGKVQPSELPRWSAPFDPPAVGAAIVVTMNGCGPAVVTGYFTQEGWLGVRCRLLDPPAWHVKQNNGNPNGHVFGAEFKLAD